MFILKKRLPQFIWEKQKKEPALVVLAKPYPILPVI